VMRGGEREEGRWVRASVRPLSCVRAFFLPLPLPRSRTGSARFSQPWSAQCTASGYTRPAMTGVYARYAPNWARSARQPETMVVAVIKKAHDSNHRARPAGLEAAAPVSAHPVVPSRPPATESP